MIRMGTIMERVCRRARGRIRRIALSLDEVRTFGLVDLF